LCAPYSVAVDAADNVIVADSGNNRILVFLQPLGAVAGGAGDTTADIVIGQPGFISNTGGSTLTTLLNPQGVAVDLHGNLYVADRANHRVTEYDAPLGNGEAPTLIIGQPDETSHFCNQTGAVGADTLCNPAGVATDGSGNLYVYDADNNRVRRRSRSTARRRRTTSTSSTRSTIACSGTTTRRHSRTVALRTWCSASPISSATTSTAGCHRRMPMCWR
jgi:hypothetical protein